MRANSCDRAAPEEARRAPDGEPALALTEEREGRFRPTKRPKHPPRTTTSSLGLSDIVEDDP